MPIQVLQVTKNLNRSDELEVERIVLETEPGILVPLVILESGKQGTPKPIVLGLAQSGKAAFLRERAGLIAELMRGGAAVCLPDLRGTGETRAGEARGRESQSTEISSTELMLGETLVGARLRDARAVLDYLRKQPNLDTRRIVVWGDSFAPVNGLERDLKIPLGIPGEPGVSEPVGGMLALLMALFEEDVRVVYARGGLMGFETVLKSQFCYLPHDVVIPGVLTAGDLCDVAAILAPRYVRLEGLVDGLNRHADLKTVLSAYEPARQAYAIASASGNLVLGVPADDSAVAQWLLASLLEK
jgi:hypothetical protein